MASLKVAASGDDTCTVVGTFDAATRSDDGLPPFIKKAVEQDHKLGEALDNFLIEHARPSLEEGIPVVIESKVNNLNRTVGTMLSYEISKKFGKEGLPDKTIQIKLMGTGE